MVRRMIFAGLMMMVWAATGFSRASDEPMLMAVEPMTTVRAACASYLRTAEYVQVTMYPAGGKPR